MARTPRPKFRCRPAGLFCIETSGFETFYRYRNLSPSVFIGIGTSVPNDFILHRNAVPKRFYSLSESRIPRDEVGRTAGGAALGAGARGRYRPEGPGRGLRHGGGSRPKGCAGRPGQHASAPANRPTRHRTGQSGDMMIKLILRKPRLKGRGGVKTGRRPGEGAPAPANSRSAPAWADHQVFNKLPC